MVAGVLPGAVALKEVGVEPVALVEVAVADWGQVAWAVEVGVAVFELDCRADRCCLPG